MTDAILAIDNLKIGFSTKSGVLPAVDGVELSLQRGKTLALLGESGCGKSLTALSILQLLPTNSVFLPGSAIHLEQKNLLKQSEVSMRGLRGRRIGMIFQEPMTSLNPVLTIGQQIAEVLIKHFGYQDQVLQTRIDALLKSVGLPDPTRTRDQYPHQLSGGMKQRVMIAMALAGEPEVLIADEPTTALDVTIQAQILKLLRDIQTKTGMAILLITHDLGVVRQMADDVAVMYAGHIVEQASCDQLFKQAQHPYTEKLFASIPNRSKRDERLEIIPGQVPPLTTAFRACRFNDRCAYAFTACNTTAPKWLNPQSNDWVRCHLYDPQIEKPANTQKKSSQQSIPASVADSNALLQVENLKVHFPIQKGIFKRTVATVKAVDDIHLTLYSGKTLALVGESGCGKTTAGRSILQLIKPTAGKVIYDQKALTQLSPRALKAYRSQLQIVFQDPFSSMNPRMMVGDIIAEGIRALKIRRGQKNIESRVFELLSQVGLPKDSYYRYPHEFSGGQRQRICIARALAVEPKVIICDEPTSALDVSVQAQILNLLRDLQHQFGLAFLFITHDMSVVSYMADHIAVMYLGRIVEQGPAQEILTAAKHPYTQSLMSAVPQIDDQGLRSVIQLEGEQPSPVNPPSGCHFHPRCPKAMAQCRQKYPKKTQLTSEHHVHCYLYDE